ncbi:MAG: Permease [Bryobacterales bacterium]|nr:Permease [Bryobacterales bacterium]
METLLADIRQSLRLMLKSPGFTVAAVAALALGIGANTAIFSVVDKVLLQPLPYPEADRIMQLERKYPGGSGPSVSIPKYFAWRQNHVFASMAIADQQGPGLNLSRGDRTEQVKGVHVSADYFKVFGVNPMIGRAFTGSEDSPSGPKAAIISQGLWRSHFGSDPNILSKTITLNSEPYPVIGVMPGSFVPNPPSDVWIPLQADPHSTNQGHYLAVLGRLKPDVTLEQARGNLKLAGEAFRREYPKFMDKSESVAVIPLQESLVSDVKPALLILLGAVTLVLFISCANVANLLLARATTRQRELAIRTAVGASRWRVVRQLLTESVMLATAGGIAGFLLGVLGVKALLSLVPGNIPLLTDAGTTQQALSLLDWRVAAFTLGLSFVTGILFGLYPALHISRTDVASVLKEATGRSGTGRHQNRLRKTLIGSEMALAVVLLAGAVLLIRTFVGLSTANPGIDPRNVLTLQTSLIGQKYATTAKVDTFVRQAVQRIEALPGVDSAAMAVALPSQTQIDLNINIAGKIPKSGDSNGDEQWRFVTPHYFKAFRIPLVRGRFFDVRDAGNSTPVLLINSSFAKKYFPKENPIGQVITIGKGLGPQFADFPRQVIGVVGDVKESGLTERNVPVMYVPQSQVSDALTQLANSALPMAWCIRSNADTTTLAPAVQREIQALDGLMAVANIRPMPAVLSEHLSRQNFNMVLLSTFAGIALLLAAIGIYGLMSYSVEQQTQELGIRLALGADHPDLVRLIVREGMLPAGVGVLLGLGIAFGLTRLLGQLLYGIRAADPVTFGGVAILLAAVALISTYIPARRTSKLHPSMALRTE